MLNVHHLELFYYVAHHRGITEAARRIPYGIQQPAISGQISLLEAALGQSLFQRRPFLLTPAGRRLFEFIVPFFSNLDTVEQEIRRCEQYHLRLAASSTALAKHLPEVISGLRGVFPDLHLTLREIPSQQSPAALLRGEVDATFTVRPSNLAPGMQFQEVLQLPLILAVPERSRIKSWKSLVQPPKNPGEPSYVDQPLISLPVEEPLAAMFQESLSQQRIHWPVRVEVASADLGLHYAAAGFGLALYVEVPGVALPEGLRPVKLPQFGQLVLGLLTLGEPKPMVRQLAKLVSKKVQTLRAPVANG